MKGVAFELEFLVFLGKKTKLKKISSFWEYFSSVVVFFLYVIIGKLKRLVHLCRKKTTKKRNNNT